MTEDLYDREVLLQRDLADFPKLLAGDQMDTAEPRRWALVAREASVPDKQGGNERWSADHLFVDQDAIPTIVEVKRSEDTRRRREVAGQMLDYVSHATLYWEADDLRKTFEETCEAEEVLPEQELAELLGDDEEAIDDFWDRIEANLRSGNVRLLFVADDIPSELKRIVEFLNEQMSTAEVLAVEVTQYTSGEKTAYVPRLYGQTEEARQSKQATTRPDHDEDDFLDDVATKESEGKLTASKATALRDLYEFIRGEADDHDFGGTANVSVTARWSVLGGSAGMFTLNSTGKVVFWQPANIHDPDESDWSHETLIAWYEDLATISHPKADVDRFTSDKKRLPIDALVEKEDRERFKNACLDFVDACSQQ
ncbi:hypothetical protein [Natrinema halophilum]|uniref:Uncharacterized protein n=1 Tax=Natrinema halophilum TaxID=1699371 RepID=A0A7D5KFP1_9EURY|nr:hypothetical protein [Natrinema halophilum]QLG51001.1 hypothetical protein HYG82_20275 [Natrinema halophilum]